VQSNNSAFKETDIINTVIAGTAGQGVITIKRLIEFAAHESGCSKIFGSEMHGLAQREGAITSHTRYQKKPSENERANLYSPSICYGDADLYIGFEPSEVLRRAQFASEKTVFCMNTYTIEPILIAAKMDEYPSLDKMREVLTGISKAVYFMDASKMALEKFDDIQKMNMIMLGFAVASGKLPFIEKEAYERVIRRELKQAEINIEAFNIGYTEGLKQFNGDSV
jgi:indolepyruvate ferredoxin oxidoreductase beta subunit